MSVRVCLFYSKYQLPWIYCVLYPSVILYMVSPRYIKAISTIISIKISTLNNNNKKVLKLKGFLMSKVLKWQYHLGWQSNIWWNIDYQCISTLINNDLSIFNCCSIYSSTPATPSIYPSKATKIQGFGQETIKPC